MTCSRSTDEDGHQTARGDVVYCGTGGALIGGDAGGLAHIKNVELMMNDAAALGRRQFCGADVHAPVQLAGIGVDDLAAQSASQLQREIRLAGACGSDDDDQRCSKRGCLMTHRMASLRIHLPIVTEAPLSPKPRCHRSPVVTEAPLSPKRPGLDRPLARDTRTRLLLGVSRISTGESADSKVPWQVTSEMPGTKEAAHGWHVRQHP